MAKSDQPVALVTGASSGFGKLTASLLSKRGYRVFGASRRPESAEMDGFETLAIDVDSDESVSKGASQLLGKTGRIDVLVNCAGYVLTGGLEESSLPEAKAEFETNFFGTVRMINSVLPYMRSAKRGCIINIGSLAAVFPVPFEGFYAATKAAIMAYTEALRYEVKPFGIRVTVVEPGFFKTNLGKARKFASTPIAEYNGARERALSRLERHIEEGADPRLVAETIVSIIESRKPKLLYRVGSERRLILAKSIVPSSTFESRTRKHWRLDE